MMGNDGRKKYFVDKKFTIYTVFLVVIVVLFIGWRVSKNVQYENCSQLKLAGHSYIKKGNPLYQSRLDLNHNNIACEE